MAEGNLFERNLYMQSELYQVNQESRDANLYLLVYSDWSE